MNEPNKDRGWTRDELYNRYKTKGNSAEDYREKNFMVTTRTWLDDRLEEYQLMDGFDDCIAGVSSRFGQVPVVCYDRNKVIKKLMDQGMTWEEAEEFHEFNQAGAWTGETTPAFITMVGDA